MPGRVAMRVSFLIPAYNEARTIEEVLDRIDELDIDRQIIVVDDGSTDGTSEIVERWSEGREGVVLIRQENRGKGAAILAAIPRIDGDVALIQDADMEYDPADVPALVEPIERGVADVVLGSRVSGARPERTYRFVNMLGNRVLTLMANVLFNTTLADMHTGYKVMRADLFRALRLRHLDFALDTEIVAKVCKHNLRIYQIPISYYPRTHEEGKKITWRDAVKCASVLLAVRMQSVSSSNHARAMNGSENGNGNGPKIGEAVFEQA